MLVFVAARFHDGPLGPIPGGALASGDLVAQPVADWSFASDIQEIELQLASQSKSRTTWVIVHKGKASGTFQRHRVSARKERGTARRWRTGARRSASPASATR